MANTGKVSIPLAVFIVFICELGQDNRAALACGRPCYGDWNCVDLPGTCCRQAGSCGRVCLPCDPGCPIGTPQNCLRDACDDAECPAQVGAKCKSRCGGCVAEFFDKYGRDVTDKCDCPRGQSPSLCKRDPCDTAKCDKEGECRTDTCGGCDAVFYDRRGRVIPSCPISSSGGVCPPPPQFGTCVEACGRGCPKPQLCCSNGCGHVCTDPIYPDCPGGKALACKPPACDVTTCPRQIQAQCRAKCFGCIPQFFDKFDNEITKACDCKPGVRPVDCFDDPCRTARCPNRPDAVCRTDTCGTCTARFYDNRGREVNCKYPDSGECPSIPLRPPFGHCANLCKRDRDCPRGQKCCSTGCGRECKVPLPTGCDSMRCVVNACRFSTCATHIRAKCKGICNGCVARFHDKFGNDITEQCSCKGRIPEADCRKNLCDKKRCPAHPDAECRINRCGTCTTAFFDKEGRKVNCDDPVPGEPRCPPQIGRPSICSDLCRRNSDCPRGQICCSNGCGRVCKAPLPSGCDTTECIVNQCEVSSCARHTQAKCFPACGSCHAIFFDKFNNDITAECPCPGRIFEANCDDDLCKRKVCRSDRNAECRINRCGGCNIEFFNREGKQVKCEKDKDDARCPARRPPGYTICISECSSNRDCRRGKVCCSYGCMRICTDPRTDLDPRCPTVRDDQAGTCAQECSSNSDCRRNQICCSNGCGTSCRNPPRDLDPRCPVVRPGQIGTCAEQCSSNSDCRRGQICCSNGCGTSCRSPPRDLDPRCPAVRPGQIGTCAEECSSNSNCRRGQICCSNGCGTTCRDPPLDARCPPPDPWILENLPVILCPTSSCSSNNDCRGNNICCFNGCTRRCISPSPIDPRCPPNDGGPGPCDFFCTLGEECGGGEICCPFGCGTGCRTPVGDTGDQYDKRCPRATAPVSSITCPKPCSKNSDCRSDFMCCKTYCGPACVRKPTLCDPGELPAPCRNSCDELLWSCPNNPEAQCRVHPCNTCRTEFYDENNLLLKDCSMGGPRPIG